MNATRRKRRRLLVRRKRSLDPTVEIDYKNPDTLKRFITERGKIIPRRISGATSAQQQEITIAVKRARFLSLIPYSVAHRKERGFSGEMTNIAQTFAASSFKGRRERRPDGDRGPRPEGRSEGDRGGESRAPREGDR